MRINVYEEELTPDVELITKAGVIGADGKPTTFAGVRFWLKGSDDLHHTPDDDDRPAVTFWFRATPDGYRHIASLLAEAAHAVGHVPGIEYP